MKRRADAPMHDFIRARVLPAEKKAVLAAAEEQGVSLSDFTRQAIAAAARLLNQQAA